MQHGAPADQFLRKAERALAGEEEGKNRGDETFTIEVRRMASGGFAIEAEALQTRALFFECAEIIQARLAYRGIQTAAAFATGDHIPDADAVRSNASSRCG